MNLYQLRQAVRREIRDDSFPAEAVDDAINRVIDEINTAGRFRFHQSEADITLVAGTWQYAIPSYFVGEEILVLNAESEDQAILTKDESILTAVRDGRFWDTGTPEFYIRRGAQFWLSPIPKTADAGDKITVYGHYNLPHLISDGDTSALPDIYENTVLVMGAAVRLSRHLKGEAQKELLADFSVAFSNMKNQEAWEPLVIPRLYRGNIWRNSHTWGSVGVLRNSRVD